MDGQVDFAHQQCLVDFLGKQPLAPGFDQRPIRDAIARRTDCPDLDVFGDMLHGCHALQRLAHDFGLASAQA